MNKGFEHSKNEQKALYKLTKQFQTRKTEYIDRNKELSKVTLVRGEENDKTSKKYSSVQFMKKCKGTDYFK